MRLNKSENIGMSKSHHFATNVCSGLVSVYKIGKTGWELARNIIVIAVVAAVKLKLISNGILDC